MNKRENSTTLEHISVDQYRKIAGKKGVRLAGVRKRTKYNNKLVREGNYVFDSIFERDYYRYLLLLQAAEEIQKLEVHPVFRLDIGRDHICNYEADFFYCDRKGRRIVVDTKGVRTDVYRIKKRLMKVLRNIDIIEVTREKRSK